jgi:DNA-binding transcriptional ArsR family regulator
MKPGPPSGVGDITGRRELRRLVGPTAWVVLEDLAADARLEGDRVVARTNVRRLADNLGLSKDTTARSLRRLVSAGLVTRAEEPRRPDGTFARASYSLNRRVLQVLGPPEGEDAPPATPDREIPAPRQRHSRGRGRLEQATLFEVDLASQRR